MQGVWKKNKIILSREPQCVQNEGFSGKETKHTHCAIIPTRSMGFCLMAIDNDESFYDFIKALKSVCVCVCVEYKKK